MTLIFRKYFPSSFLLPKRTSPEENKGAEGGHISGEGGLDLGEKLFCILYYIVCECYLFCIGIFVCLFYYLLIIYFSCIHKRSDRWILEFLPTFMLAARILSTILPGRLFVLSLSFKMACSTLISLFVYSCITELTHVRPSTSWLSERLFLGIESLRRSYWQSLLSFAYLRLTWRC